MPVVMGPHSVLDLGALSLRLNEGMDDDESLYARISRD